MIEIGLGITRTVLTVLTISLAKHQSAYPCGQPPVGWFSGRVGLVYCGTYRRDVTRCLCCFKTPGGNAGRDIPTPESWSRLRGRITQVTVSTPRRRQRGFPPQAPPLRCRRARLCSLQFRPGWLGRRSTASRAGVVGVAGSGSNVNRSWRVRRPQDRAARSGFGLFDSMLSCGGFEAPPPAPDRILGFGFVPPALRRYSASALQLRVLVLVGVVHPAASSSHAYCTKNLA